MNSENQLWKIMRSGDADAFTRLYRDYYQFLFSFGFRLCADKNLTKDSIHEVFIEVWDSRLHLPQVEHVGFYLKTYLRRKIVRVLEKQKQTTKDTVQTTFDTSESSYEELLVQLQSREELREKIKAALQMLSKRQVEIIKMKFFEDKTYDEISEITSTSPRTVYNQMYRSLKIMRSCLKMFF